MGPAPFLANLRGTVAHEQPNGYGCIRKRTPHHYEAQQGSPASLQSHRAAQSRQPCENSNHEVGNELHLLREARPPALYFKLSPVPCRCIATVKESVG
eukprot:763373-Hanusia_phi.AAC.6